MGVHKLDVYPQVKELLEIPKDEPLFIIRAQDVLGDAAVAAYRALYSIGAQVHEIPQQRAQAFSDHLTAVETAFLRFQITHKSSVKFPD